ncbi:contact-dependent growth inhibition system immunity protein [Photorhabdus sp. SF281]|uniref:contact-dependent growth inhibition system immunity protein n=1 Tax=Photorhabdus sp. SF281 TaxID=3459527 RepID=UPI0040439BD1
MSMDFKQGLNATAMFNGSFYSVKTYSGYRLLLADPQSPEHILSPDITDSQLGSAVLDSLSKSRLVDPDDDFFDNEKTSELYDEWIKQMMKTYNYRSRRQLFKKMHNCGIQLLDSQITIRPSCHEKLDGWSGDGFSETDYVVIPADSSPEEVGAALRLAFSRCRSYV